MTVAFIDVPGSRLPTVDAPLNFTASGDVAAISVGFGAARVEERVYRDGVFLWPYLQSTKTGNAFRIVRDGGWPSDPQIYVDEATAAPATFWSVLYDKDLRTLPDQTVSATMASSYLNFTADGQPWCFHGAAGSLMIVNGQGMVGVTDDDTTTNGAYQGLHVSMKIYQMAGYDVTKETAVQVRFSNLISGAATGGASVWCSPSEKWGYGPGDEVALQRWYGGAWSRFSSLGVELNMAQAPQPATESYSTIVLAVSQMPIDRLQPGSTNGKTNYRAGYFKRNASPTDWPSMESMTPNGGSTGRTDINVNALKMGWFAGSAPYGTNKTITATHIRVLQRPVT
jgi:hypothetical protein